MKLFEYVIIDKTGEMPVIMGTAVPQMIFAADKGTAEDMIKKEHVNFDGTSVEIRIREF